MVVAACTHDSKKKHGKDRNGNQRTRCLLCGQTFVERGPKPIGDMRIKTKDAATVLGMLLEGMSIRACERITGINRDTICRLIKTAGENCQALFDSMVVDVPVSDIQCDEIWSFVGMKEKTKLAREYGDEVGDSWTFIAIERNTKLILAHKVGLRDLPTCLDFLRDLKRATSGRFQVSTDGLNVYTNNVPFELGGRVDFAQLIKVYSGSQDTTRYSPARIIDAEKVPRFGNPDWDRICTSHIERANLTVRMQLRRFTRLTNAHSKCLKHHTAMQAVFFAWYNFCRGHESLKGKTPAMVSGLAEKRWTIKELLERAAQV